MTSGVLDTLPKYLTSDLEKFGADGVAGRKKDMGIWHEYSWKDFYETTKYFSLGLLCLGLRKTDRVAIIGDAAPEWLWAELATQAAGGTAVGMFVDSARTEIEYIVDHSDARFVIAGDQEQVDKILALQAKLSRIERIIYWDDKGLWGYDDSRLMSFGEVQDLGREYERDHPDAFEQSVRSGSGDDIAACCYTSGTTGAPKGAFITHKNLIEASHMYFQNDPVTDRDNIVCFFPPAWYAGQVAAIAIPIVSGATANYPETAETTEWDKREVNPRTGIFSPKMWEDKASQIKAFMEDGSSLSKLIYNSMLPIGYKMTEFAERGANPSVFWKILHQSAEWGLFRQIKDKLGVMGLKYAITGSATFSYDAFKFFRALGIPLRQGYALTEGGWVSTHPLDDIDLLTTGPPSRGQEVRISDDGEILLRSTCLFSGYHKNPEETAKKLEWGWYHTSDAGHINDRGHLVFLERMADLTDLAGGGKFAPGYIEGRLRFSTYVKDVMTIGGKERPYVSAIINIDFENVSRWAERNKLSYTTRVDLSQKDEVYELVKGEVSKINKSLPEESRIRRFVNLHKEFDADDAELTRSRKVKRTQVEVSYKDIIDVLYGKAAEVELGAKVAYRDGRTGTVSTRIKAYTVE